VASSLLGVFPGGPLPHAHNVALALLNWNAVCLRRVKAAHTSEQRLAECLSEMYNLESQVNNKEALLPFTKPGGKRLDALERSEIVKTWTSLSDISAVFWCFQKSRIFVSILNLHDQQSDLPALSRRIFGGSMTVRGASARRTVKKRRELGDSVEGVN
jgi:hypothetical protein